MRAFDVALVSVCVVACSAPAPVRAPTPTSASHAAAANTANAAPEDEWSQLSWEDRHDVMTWAVEPNMSPAPLLRSARRVARGWRTLCR